MLIAGVDEAGRGPLAGPVVSAAVILNPKKRILGLKDSKLLTREQRESLFTQIMQHAIAFGIGQASVEEIDSLNILKATLLSMKRAVAMLAVQPVKVLVDGNRCPELDVETLAIIGGDITEPSISAASILAKVTRDRVMIMYEEQFPGYGFAQHKGYGTVLHREALKKIGPSVIHRRSFAPVKQFYEQAYQAQAIIE